MGVIEIDIDVIEEMLTHEIVIALRVVVREATVLVQVIGNDLGEIDIALFVPFDKLLIGADGRGARCQAQHAIGLEDNLSRDDIGRLAAHVGIVFCCDDLHYASFLSDCGTYLHPADGIAVPNVMRPPGRGRVMLFANDGPPRRGPCPSMAARSVASIGFIMTRRPRSKQGRRWQNITTVNGL